MATKTAEQVLTLRITVIDPPADVEFQVQHGRDELTAPVRVTNEAIVFEFPVRVGTRPTGEPNFLGPYAQGPTDGRFVYVNSGTLAGQSDSCWTRRAKVSLTSIGWPLIERARRQSGVLEVSFKGTGRDGGPTCASVKDTSGWRVADA
jgi:Family of unknown function (DUF5990)